MADPLSIAAGVVGLITAAAQVTKILHNVTSKAKHAPDDTRKIMNEVDDIRNVLGSLQLYLVGVERVHKSRTSLIMVDQVVATLAACVTTFSDLDTFVEGLQNESEMKILDRLRWFSKEKDIQAILARLQSHKNSLTLMLNILSCQKQEDAESRVDTLCNLVEEMLSQNIVLKHRMAALEIQSAIPNQEQTLDFKMYQSPVQDDNEQVIVSPDSAISVAQSSNRQRSQRGFAFEELLLSSRVYRIAAKYNSDAFSVISSAGRTASWSMLSGLSLSEVSHIGIQALPIYATDITNKDHYDFTPTASLSVHWQTPTSTNPDRVEKTSRRSWFRDFLRVPKHADPVEENVPGIFGVSLNSSIKYANVAIALHDEAGKPHVYGYIPIPIAKAGVFLKEKATRIEDIFAINGNPVRMSRLQKAFDTPPEYGKGLVWDDYTCHDAAGILLRYLKTLPEPVIPYEHYEAFITGLAPFIERELDSDESAEAITAIKSLIVLLPSDNRQLLLYLLDTIAVFADRVEQNKMTALRLISSFQPSVLANVPSAMDAEAHHTAAQVALVMVTHENELVSLNDI